MKNNSTQNLMVVNAVADLIADCYDKTTPPHNAENIARLTKVLNTPDLCCEEDIDKDTIVKKYQDNVVDNMFVDIFALEEDIYYALNRIGESEGIIPYVNAGKLFTMVEEKRKHSSTTSIIDTDKADEYFRKNAEKALTEYNNLKAHRLHKFPALKKFNTIADTVNDADGEYAITIMFGTGNYEYAGNFTNVIVGKSSIVCSLNLGYAVASAFTINFNEIVEIKDNKDNGTFVIVIENPEKYNCDNIVFAYQHLLD